MRSTFYFLRTLVRRAKLCGRSSAKQEAQGVSISGVAFFFERGRGIIRFMCFFFFLAERRAHGLSLCEAGEAAISRYALEPSAKSERYMSLLLLRKTSSAERSSAN